MKTLVFFFLTFLAVNIYSQKREFLRIYNLVGKKIANGRDYKITDSTIEFKDINKIIHYSQINFIRTKHSFGHNIGLGSLIGIGSFGLFTLAANVQSDLFDKGTVVILFSTFIGAPSGALIGAISNVFKKPKKFDINGDIEKWKKFRSFFLTISK